MNYSDVHYCEIKHGTWRAQIATASESGNYCDTLKEQRRKNAVHYARTLRGLAIVQSQEILEVWIVKDYAPG